MLLGTKLPTSIAPLYLPRPRCPSVSPSLLLLAVFPLKVSGFAPRGVASTWVDSLMALPISVPRVGCLGHRPGITYFQLSRSPNGLLRSNRTLFTLSFIGGIWGSCRLVFNTRMALAHVLLSFVPVRLLY